jgi:hypothetical protein
MKDNIADMAMARNTTTQRRVCKRLRFESVKGRSCKVAASACAGAKEGISMQHQGYAQVQENTV